MADAAARPGQGAQGARPEAQGVAFEIVVVEDRPSPADDRVGVDVRAVGEPELVRQRVP